jgi:molybdenum cofactor guanylyltransferase
MSTSHRLTGFILAGGKSVRMGRDKALLDWHGRTLLEHMVNLMLSASDTVHVVGRDPLPDRLPGLGPLSGIATALEASNTDANIVVAVDLPLLTKEFLKYLRSRAELSDDPLIACKIGSDFPLCLAIRRTVLPQILRRLSANKLSIRRLIEDSQSLIIPETELRAAGFGPALFRNINTDRDYEDSR